MESGWQISVKNTSSFCIPSDPIPSDIFPQMLAVNLEIRVPKHCHLQCRNSHSDN